MTRLVKVITLGQITS